MRRNFFIVLVLSVLMYSANFWGYSIYILDEAKNSACAMEMMQRGDWVVPTFNGELRTDKPPLHYFFMIASYKVFGINSFGARFFSILMGIGTVLSVYFFVRKIINENAAFYSSLILIASLQMMVQFHLAVPDPYLIFFITFGLLSFSYAWLSKRALYFYLFYASIGLAFMAKGPVAVLVAGLTVLLFLIVNKEFSFAALLKMKIIPGALLFLVIVLPWWIAVTVKTDGAWLNGFLFEHNVKRFTSTMEGHRSLPGLALVIVFTGLFPFSAFLPQAVKTAWKERSNHSLLLVCLSMCTVIILFFSFSRTILPSYPAPCVPFGAIILGFFFSQWMASDEKRKGMWVSASFMVVISVLLPLAGYIALKQDAYLNDLSAKAFFLLICSLGAITGTWFLYQNKLQAFFLSYAISFVLAGVVIMYFVMPSVMVRNPVDQSLAKIESRERTIVCYRKTNPAYIFNLAHPVATVTSPEELQQFILSHPKVTILSRVDDSQDIQSLGYKTIYTGKDLFENPTTVVMEN